MLNCIKYNVFLDSSVTSIEVGLKSRLRSQIINECKEPNWENGASKFSLAARCFASECVCLRDSHSQAKSRFNQADWAHVKHLKNVPPPRRSLNLCEADADCLRVHLKINYFRCSKYSLRVEQFISLWFQDRRRVLSWRRACIYIIYIYFSIKAFNSRQNTNTPMSLKSELFTN